MTRIKLLVVTVVISIATYSAFQVDKYANMTLAEELFIENVEALTTPGESGTSGDKTWIIYSYKNTGEKCQYTYRNIKYPGHFYLCKKIITSNKLLQNDKCEENNKGCFKVRY